MKAPLVRFLPLVAAVFVMLLLALSVMHVTNPSAGASGELTRTSAPSRPQAGQRSILSRPGIAPRRISDEEDMAGELRRVFTAGTDEQKKQALSTQLPELVRMKPAMAAALCVSLSPGTERDQSLRVLMATWSLLDAATALNWAAGLPDPAEREFAMEEAYREIGRHDPRQALELLREYDTGCGRKVVNELIQQWAESDPRATLEWLDAHPASAPDADERWSALALVMSRSAPANAASLVVERIPPGPIQTEAVIAVVHQWALRDPAGAAAWVDLFSEGELQLRAQNELTGISDMHASESRPAP